MHYVPVRCDACSVVSLVLEQSCQSGEAACPECRAPASVLPGCAYADDDLALFVELRGLLQQAELSPVEAGELVLILDSLVVSKDDQRALSNLLEHVPTLAPALPIVTSHPFKLRQALTLLSTLIHDRAFARVSGTVELDQLVARQRA